jgi:hypothetical protein
MMISAGALRHIVSRIALAVVTACLCLAGCGGQEVVRTFSGYEGDAESENVARKLGRLHDRMTEVDRAVVATQPEQPLTPASLRDFGNRVAVVLSRYEPIQREIAAIQNEAQAVHDLDVRAMAPVLETMIVQRYDGMKRVATALASGEVTSEVGALIQEMADVQKETNAKWRVLSLRINERY